MKFTLMSTVFLAAATSVFATPMAPVKRGVNPSQVLDFGVARGKNPTGTGDCSGLRGIKIPCSCPPTRADFINSLNANVKAGHDIHNPAVPAPFPSDNSIRSQITRLQTQISSLQNLRGPGVGCPAVSTNWNDKLAQLIARQKRDDGEDDHDDEDFGFDDEVDDEFEDDEE
ncbi:hypothetical protein MIND_00895500 [Mycena indigotica]|uniref:Uncharacterized protein n=1 Tax=Mycena indigotica TaxID=2126181 RepID=A0A8H6SIW0_9AGAR|nr:uncharacterized protein MIND_00895500 [Mycena indigotica]KAF7299456.1 hypothetical protein MIND_00895500 [Mycena indigotica]